MRTSTQLALAILTLLPSVCVVAYADDVEKSSGQHVYYLGDERVVVLHFNVLIDGKSAQVAWDEFLDRRFKALDADNDGVLRGEEKRRLPSQQLLVQMGLAGQAPTLKPNDGPFYDTEMTPNEFKEHYRRLGLESFRVRIDSGNASTAGGAALRRQGLLPDESPRVLFEKLDSDGNGQLAADEFRNAQYALRKLDLDRDELISTNELVQLANLFQVAMPVNPNAEPPKPKFLSLSSGQSPRTLAQQLLAARDGHGGTAKDNRLSFNELGLPVEKLQPFDPDGDGSLDFEETQQFLSDPPSDVELIVRLGITRGQQPIEILAPATGGAPQGAGSLTFGKVQMELAAPQSYGMSDERELTQRFKSMDQDNNGYLEAMEIQRFGVNAQMLAMIDGDQDGKVFPQEFQDFYRPLAEMEQARAQLDVADRGHDLFRMLDANGDGRLGVREFTAAVERMTGWDRNGDGKLAESEIAQQFRLSVSRGTISATGRVVVATPSMCAASLPRPAAVGGPAWFTKMDRNGDGDVSAREFLGPAELFSKFDADSNGLLDREEATAADKLSQ